MEVFRSDTKMLRSILVRNVALYVGAFCTVVLISRSVGYELGRPFYACMLTAGVSRSVGILLKHRLVQLAFDDIKGSIVFEYKSFLGRVREREITSSESRFKMRPSRMMDFCKLDQED